MLYEVNTRAFSATGDFQGVIDRLPELQELGVTVLWLMPVHPSGETGRKGPLGSPYAVRDYYAVNPAYGTAEDLRRLVDEAHKRDLRVILDVVANHTALDSVLVTEHPEWLRRGDDGAPVSSEPGWDDVVALDYSQEAVCEYMWTMMSHWLTEFGFDGLRCDVAHYVPVEFWRELRRRVGPEVFLLAESETAPMFEGAFDAGYSWKLFHTVNHIFTDGMPATRLREKWEKQRQSMPEGTLLLRFTDNHDETRAIVRLGERAALAASALMFLLDGIPLLYNGQEVGDTTESAPPALFDRVPIYWGNGQRRPEFLRFYQQLIRLRRAHSALQQGEVIWTFNTDAGRIASFVREGGNQEFIVAINCSNRPFAGHVDGGNAPVSLGPYGVLVRERKWGKMLEI
ncbi:hypothetical protein F183_A23990 [Bryobacterales bacterium F-183]|nr:hypothetical protein F183_A23990 [Bryobacterales bacterium F-183]